MDCEKYEPLLLDELYEELDEVTSAAVKRHVSGCARCAAVLHGMRATRRLISFPMVEVPVGLEDRIMAAAKEAQKVVPIQSRFSRAVSVAGRWAMRPQTAMAAVFLLMIGTTTFVIRSNKARHATDAVSVTEEGTPQAEPVAQVGDPSSLNSPAAASAHGAAPPKVYTQPPVAVAPAATTTSLVAANERENSAGPMDRLTKGAARDGKDKNADDDALGSVGLKEEQKQEAKLDLAKDAKPEVSKKVAVEGRSAPAKPSTRGVGGAGQGSYANNAPAADPISNAGPPAGAPYGGDYAPAAQSPAPPPPAQQKRASDPQDQFSAGMASYRTRSFGDAQKSFDSAASAGDQNAALWAARAVKEGTGCSAALSRFDAVAAKGGGSWVANEAQLEAAKCQIAMGQLDPARTRLNNLAKTTSHAAQAQTALTELNAVAARRSGGSGAPAAAARPAPAPKSPVRSVDQSEKSQKAASEAGF